MDNSSVPLWRENSSASAGNVLPSQRRFSCYQTRRRTFANLSPHARRYRCLELDSQSWLFSLFKLRHSPADPPVPESALWPSDRQLHPRVAESGGGHHPGGRGDHGERSQHQHQVRHGVLCDHEPRAEHGAQAGQGHRLRQHQVLRCVGQVSHQWRGWPQLLVILSYTNIDQILPSGAARWWVVRPILWLSQSTLSSLSD